VLKLQLEENRDAVGAVNIGLPRTKLPVAAINRAARPLLLRWNGMNWKDKSSMNNGTMNILGTGSSQLWL